VTLLRNKENHNGYLRAVLDRVKGKERKERKGKERKERVFI